MHLRILIPTLLVILVSALPARAVDVQRVVSPGGIEAWLVEDHSNPIISLDLAFVGGSALDPAGKEGLANMVSALLDEGAGEIDSQAFQEKLANNSIQLSFSASQDTFEGSLRTLTENRDLAFELLRLAVSEPRFDPEPVDRIRSQLLAILRDREEDPNTIAGRELIGLFYPDHPYGRARDGTPETVAGLTQDDLKGFVAKRFSRGNIKVGVVGDITPEELGRLLDVALLGLPEKAAPSEIAEVRPQNLGEVLVIEKPIPQSVVIFGHEGIKREDPDFYAAYVLNHILGGGSFSSRLYQEVREQRGLAYSVYSFLRPMDYSALYLGGVATANPRVGESLDIIRKEWARMAEEGPSEEELNAAKVFLTGSYPLRQRSSGRIAGMLLGIQLGELGIDYINQRNDFIDTVSLDDVRRVAERLLQEDKLTVVIVGQPEGVEATRVIKADGS
ncbi:MAG: pitrilysin family protein [Pseudomonadota bacterium]